MFKVMRPACLKFNVQSLSDQVVQNNKIKGFDKNEDPSISKFFKSQQP